MLTGAAMLLASATSAPSPLAIERERLRAAKAEAAQAAARASDLARRAAAERDAVAKAQAEEAVMGARIDRAEATVAAARARVAIVEALLERQRAILGERQKPVARLVAALSSLARRPVAAAIVQPGSVTDLVHVRAVLGSALPAIRQETAGLREELAQSRRLRAGAAAAAEGLERSRRDLISERRALAAVRARHASAAVQLNRDALAQSDRAIALGEEARDIIDRMALIGQSQAKLEELAALRGPPRSIVSPQPSNSAYRLPVGGRLVTGFGEVSENGVRSRGLTFAVGSRAIVRAPAAGRVILSRPFRRYGTIVIIDHGAGWNSLVTGIGDPAVKRGDAVAAGDPVGRAPNSADPLVTVELRRQGRPVDMVALIG
ncbi:murein hydrolase activator EnvC family protein [Sphingomonas sp. IC4-52]|uniref:murein hydrolase activator EnvC family protein n=1 Tax=Sphingomonas sp. IC4-52 TaxID=2887202 RepID=UPI001D12DF83|nr:peptidoglycan DD-metalloendopeptidase family protein [Sphingomonas sp. IC4-52]MCC2979734.1 peptidoglycan DD-metalloendopeptidase family protein [Sphingomonas sp. IC4-52]